MLSVIKFPLPEGGASDQGASPASPGVLRNIFAGAGTQSCVCLVADAASGASKKHCRAHEHQVWGQAVEEARWKGRQDLQSA